MLSLVSRARGTRSSNVPFSLSFVPSLTGVAFPGCRGPCSAPCVENGTSALRVAVHLGHERRGTRKALLAAQPAHELDAQSLAVQVAVEVEEVNLEDPCARLRERRPDAERGDAVVSVRCVQR